MSECAECEEVAPRDSVLCDACAAKELRQRVVELLDSAHPNPSDHPKMTWAWERAKKTLERVGGVP